MPAITSARQSTYDDLLSTTLQAYRPTLVDQVFKAIPFFWFLYDRGRIKHQRGGESIWQIINKRANGTTQWFEGEDSLDTTPQETFTTVAYPWKYIAGSVSIPLTDEQKNSGAGRIKDLLRARMENLQLSMRSDINEALFDTTNGDATKADQPYGLGDIIEDAAQSGSQTNVVAGISKSVVENGEYYWENQYDITTDWESDIGTGDALPKMDTMYNNCSEGIDNTDLILGTQTLWEEVKQLLQGNQRWMSTDDRVASIGFQNLVFNGALFMFDKSSTYAADTMTSDQGGLYFINTNYLYMMTDPAYEFRPTPFKMATNQLTRVAQVVTACQLVCTNMRRQGVLVAEDG